MASMKPTLVILAGGRSSRFGSNKVFAEIHGKPMWLPAARQAFERSWDVFLSGHQEALAVFGFPVIEDFVPYRGPLAALHDILEQVTSPRILVMACDMPFFPPALMELMWQQDADVLFLEKEKVVQPLPALYAQEILPQVKKLLSSGRSDLKALQKLPGAFVLEEKLWRQHDPEGLCFWNINTPQDFAQLSSQTFLDQFL